LELGNLRLFLITNFFFLFTLNTQPLFATPLKTCLTGTLPKVFPGYGDAFFQGAQLALNDQNVPESALVLKRHFYDQNPLAPIAAFDAMIRDDCLTLVGFDFTNELMMVRKQA